MLSWNFLVNGFVIRAILSIMSMEMDDVPCMKCHISLSVKVYFIVIFLDHEVAQNKRFYYLFLALK